MIFYVLKDSSVLPNMPCKFVKPDRDICLGSETFNVPDLGIGY